MADGGAPGMVFLKPNMPGIPLLDQSNYTVWRMRMRITAEHLGLWDAFVNVLPQPLSQADAERDRRGKAFIGMHCSDLFMFHVEQATSAKAAWDILIALNAASSSARKLLLRQKMVGFKMSAREGVLEYFTKASQLRSDLAAAEEPMSDNQAVHMILAGLPARFNTTVQILQNNVVLSPTECLAKLLVAEQMLDAREEEPPTAYFSRSGGGAGGGGGAKRRWDGDSSRGAQQGGGTRVPDPQLLVVVVVAVVVVVRGLVSLALPKVGSKVHAGSA